MTDIRVLIADDEPLAREAIRLRLGLYPKFDVIAEADNGLDAYLLLNSLQPDVVFMDINMPKLTGLEALEKIQSSWSPCLIFVTAYKEHALQAFRLDALDYLTKPVNDELFAEVIHKIQQRIREKKASQQLAENPALLAHEPQYLKRLSVKEDGETLLIDTVTIRSIRSVKDYLCIKTPNQTYIQRQTMQHMETLLDPAIFLRCHRSHMVNKNFVSKWVQEESENYLLCDGEKLPVSRRLRAQVRRQFQ